MTAKTNFRGSFTALVTPFKNGAVDEKAFRDLVEWQISEGTNGLVPVGTTGESPTLSHDEHRLAVEWCIDQAKDRVPVIAGAGSNSTREVIDMSVDTMKRLYELKNIAGVKDATANVVRASQQRAAMGPEFNQLSGEDATALGFMAHGGHGCISVTSNVAPRLCAEFQGACLRGDFSAALKLQDKLMPLHTNLFVETNPSPAKYALSVLGKCPENVRLPMVPLAEKSKAAVREAMVHAGLIN